MKSILITGAAGFVGSHLCEQCLKDGYRVVGIDDLSMKNIDNLKWCQNQDNFHFLKIDLIKEGSIKKIYQFVKNRKIKRLETVVHLAAKKIPRYGNRNETIRANFNTTEITCEVAKMYRAKIIFASTSDVYGLTTQFPFIENGNAVFGPSWVGRWSYGASKYLSEQYLWGWQEENNLPIVILRIFGVYGPRQVKGYLGNAVSAFFEQAMENKIFELHGDGKQTRSFVFIDDLIRGIMKAINRKSANNRIINIGNLEEISMKSLARKIYHLVKSKGVPKYKLVEYNSFTGKEYQDIMAKLPDLTIAKKYLGWNPTISLNDGLKQTAIWYSSSR